MTVDGELERASQNIAEYLQSQLKEKLQPFLDPSAPGTPEAHNFDRMLYVAERGGNIPFEPLRKPIYLAMRAAIVHATHLPYEYSLPAKLSIESILVKMDDMGLRRRLTCVIAAELYVRYNAANRKVTTVVSRTPGAWLAEPAADELLKSNLSASEQRD